MDGLLAILRAAHCRSTHHYFAIDALRYVRSDAGQQLAKMLLRYHRQYLDGAKDPDTRFRDFQNHVVHVADSHWGGAPRAAERWYGRVQAFLREQAWADAAHAVGVLSHYFTDPLQPLHTAQSDREAVVHRPLEWSIYKSYQKILSRWRDDRFRIIFRLSNRGDWLASAVLRGAELAHRSYETLVSTYDLDAARQDPCSGLNETSLEALSELFGVAIVGWARVLDRTAEEAEGHLPHVALTPTAFRATLAIPRAWLIRRIENKQELTAVLELLDHYHQTGQLGIHLPDEVRLVRKVLKIRDSEREYVRRLENRRLENQRLENQHAKEMAPETTLRVVAPTPSVDPKVAVDPNVAVEPKVVVEPNEPTDILPFNNSVRQLTLASPIVDAPSIGPKTAARLAALGIVNISQFLGTNPEEVVQSLRVRWITVEQVADWQAQTRLMMTLPRLRVRDAQLLVGVGCRTTQLLETAKLEELTDKLQRYVLTPNGRRFLRGASAPTTTEVQSWIHHAQQQSTRAA